MQYNNEIAPGLTINQRNLYRYYLHHKAKHKNAPCFVPSLAHQGIRYREYIKALDALERKNLISLDRFSPNYTGWIMKDPSNKQQPSPSKSNETVFK
jgi:hypothetical protein